LYSGTDHETGDLALDTFAWKLWIRSEVVPEIFKKAHDSPLASHGGVHKTLKHIRKYYFSPGLVADVKESIGSCDICRKTKAPNRVTRPPIGISPESQYRLSVAFFHSFGN